VAAAACGWIGMLVVPSAAAGSVPSIWQEAEAESPAVIQQERPQIRPRPGADGFGPRLADVSWEYDRYRVQVWLIGDGSEVLRQQIDRVAARIKRDAILEESDGWRVLCAAADDVWRARLNAAWPDQLADWTEELAGEPSLTRADKLILVRLAKVSEGFSVESRELDFATRRWSPLVTRTASELDRIPAQAFAAVRRSFMPLVRIERVAGDAVYVRTRATALSRAMIEDETGNWREVENQHSPLRVDDSDVLVPVVRRDTREGKLASAEPVSWTFLTIQERLGTTLKCLLNSAHYAPLSGRSGSLIQKLAIVVRPEPTPTTLFVVAQESKTESPISGLEVFRCRPEDLESKAYEVLGKTDWKGSITVPPYDDGSICYIIVKNGQLAMKRPIYPGLDLELTAPIPSDRARVFAEGVVEGLRGEIIDVAAQRATLKFRIDSALAKEQFERATKLFNDEYSTLPSIRELALRLVQSRDRLLSRRDADPAQRKRIETMFDGLEQGISRTLMGKRSMFEATDLTNRVLNQDSGPPAEFTDPGGIPETADGEVDPAAAEEEAAPEPSDAPQEESAG
jgi:hypothetical protein